MNVGHYLRGGHEHVGTARIVTNPGAVKDPWMPHFEVGGGCWIYKHDNRCYTVQDISGEKIRFTDGQGGSFILNVQEAAKLMRPT